MIVKEDKLHLFHLKVAKASYILQDMPFLAEILPVHNLGNSMHILTKEGLLLLPEGEGRGIKKPPLDGGG
jgi:hypothetical protein